MPKSTERMLGTQLWLNLPSKDKMTKPKYRSITKEDIPVVVEKGKKVHIICGSYNETRGAMEADYVKALYLDVELAQGAEWSIETRYDDTLFVYILEGEASFSKEIDRIIPQKHAILFNKGKTFAAKASDNGVRFLLMSGAPLKEPIAGGGPIVMNTKEELELAFKELDENTFIK